MFIVIPGTTSSINCLHGSTLTATKKKHSIRLSLGEPSERQWLTYNGCSKSAYIDLHPDGHPSESTVYTGPTLTATKEKQPMRLSLGEPLKDGDHTQWPLGASLYESSWQPPKWVNSLHGSYPNDYKEKIAHTATLREPPWKMGTRP